MRDSYKKRLDKIEQAFKPENEIYIYYKKDGLIKDKAGNVVNKSELRQGKNIVNIFIKPFEAVWGHEAKPGDDFITSWEDSSAGNSSQG